MRMKLNNSGQLLLAAAASLLAAGTLTACNQLTGTLTVDFVYVTSAKAAGPNNYGEVDVFEINSESGHMRQIPTSPFPSGGRNPVAEVVAPDQTSLYVVNQDDNTIVQFVIGNDGKVYPQKTVNTAGIFPVAVGVSGNALLVADTYQPLPTCSPAEPCAGSISGFPLAAASGAEADSPITGLPLNSCNGPLYLPLTLSGAASSDIVTPTAISTLAKGSNVFVAAKDTTSGTGYVFGYTIGTTQCQVGGQSQNIITLTPTPGSPWTVGIAPSAVVQDPSGSYLYVADSATNEIWAYSITAGGLTPIAGSPFGSGNKPDAIVIDAKNKYAFVANSQDSTITGYTISGGALTRNGSYPVGTQPVAIGIDPALNQFLFTADFLGNTVTGFDMNAADGTLIDSQFSPFAASANPTAVAAVTHAAVAKQ